MAFEAKYTVPLVGVSSAASRCSKVLLPAPDGATIATISPRRKIKFASVKIDKLFSPVPYVFFKLRASRIADAETGENDESGLTCSGLIPPCNIRSRCPRVAAVTTRPYNWDNVLDALSAIEVPPDCPT